MTFYKLCDKGNSCIDYGEGNDWETILCPKDENHQRAGKRITGLKIDLIFSRIVDFSWTTLSDIVVTDRVFKLFKEMGLTGYDVKPARIVSFSKKIMFEHELTKFWEFIVTGQGGNAHIDSGIILQSKCEVCGLKRYSAYEYGIVVDDKKRDGSDFFTVIEYPNVVLVTEKVKKIIDDHNLTNAEFIKSSKLKWPNGVISN